MPCSQAIEFCGLREIELKSYASKFYSTKYYKQTYWDIYPISDEMYLTPTPFNLISNTKYLQTCGMQVRNQLKNNRNITPNSHDQKM